MSATANSLELPSRFVADCPGLAIHAVDNALYIVYRDKQDWETYQKKSGDKSRNNLRYTSLQSTDPDKILDFCNEHVYLTSASEVHVTGKIPENVEKALKEKYQIKLKYLNTFECLVGAHQYLFQHIPTNKIKRRSIVKNEEVENVLSQNGRFLHTIPYLRKTCDWELFVEEAKQRGDKIRAEFGIPVKSEEKADDPFQVPGDGYPGLAEMEDSLSYYPCLMVHMDKQVTYIKINPCGQNYEVIDVNNRCMDTLLGFGSLLTGAKSFEELINLAEKGYEYNIHYTDRQKNAELLDPDHSKKGNLYDRMLENDGKEVLLFCMGQAQGKTKDDFKKEDIAAALLTQSILDCIQSALNIVLCKASYKYVMVCGRMTERPHVAKHIVLKWYQQTMLPSTFQGKVLDVKFEMLNFGSHFESIGCMVNSVNRFHPE